MEFVQGHLLSWIVFLPLAAGSLLFAAHSLLQSMGQAGLPARLCTVLGCGASVLPFVLALSLLEQFDATDTGFQFVEHFAWSPDLGVSYFIGVDGISLFMLLLTTFLVPVILLATCNEIREGILGYVFVVLFLETCVLGGFASLNLVQFYAFWELGSLPLFFLVGVWGGEGRLRSANRFGVRSALGTLSLWIAIFIVASLQFDQFGRLDFNLVSLEPDAYALLDTVVPVFEPGVEGNSVVAWQVQTVLFGLFALAFAMRIPLIPFHSAPSDFQLGAPTAGAALVLGVTVKLGIYGFIRYAIPLSPSGAAEFAPVLAVLALLGVVVGALAAMSQKDLRQCVFYIAFSQLGLVTLGVFSFNLEGLSGSVIQMLSHGICIVALVLLVGMLRERRQTSAVSSFGGLAKPMPVFSAVWGLCAMATLGLPALSGFVGEFLILLGVYRMSTAAAGVALLGCLLAFVFMVRLMGQLLFGSVTEATHGALSDLGLREKVVVGALVVPILGMGVYPEPLLRRIEPSVIEWLEEVRKGRESGVQSLDEYRPALHNPSVIDVAGVPR